MDQSQTALPTREPAQSEGGEYTIFREMTVGELCADSDAIAPQSAKVLVAIRKVTANGREDAVDTHVAEMDAAGKWKPGTAYVPLLPRYTKPIVRTGKTTRYS